jgi:GTP-binding protein
LIIRKAEFITSAADALTEIDSPQFVMCGRSNVGKSSFINMLANNSKLAKTSKDPGRTRLINYFSFNGGEFTLVDLPGYGYARVSDAEKQKWAGMIEGYLNHSENLVAAFVLLDIRHPATKDDLMMINYLYASAKPFVLIATKADKLSKSQIANQKRALAQSLKVGEADIIAVSSLTRYGKEAVLDKIESLLALQK